jgi:glucose/arabinose dehydrogenase
MTGKSGRSLRRFFPRILCGSLLWMISPPAMATVDQTIAPEIRPIPVITTGLQMPLFLTHAGDGSGRLYIVEQAGKIRTIERGKLLPEPFLDLADRVRSGGERGLLGLAFHPDYARNGRFFVNYTRQNDGATVLAEFRRSSSLSGDASGERILMVIPQPYANHNGGMIAFGPDRFLYIGMGDGGGAGDTGNRAQNPQELLGKILRIDVDRGEPYAIPPDNPFAKSGGRPEIYALGLRNPGRFSFDRETGDLWVADVGQNKWEEIDRVTRGGNYGWRVMEGGHCFSPPEGCESGRFVPPLAEYGHQMGRCSVTGGYVYRGRLTAILSGRYLYGDYCSGEVFSLKPGGRGEPPSVQETLRRGVSSRWHRREREAVSGCPAGMERRR